MNKHFVLKEHSYLGISGSNTVTEIDKNLLLPKSTFEQIEQFVLENSEMTDGTTVVDFLHPSYKKNIGKILKTQNYVGLIETRNKTVIEILPKIFTVEDEKETRGIFLRMLKTLKNTPFKHLDQSHLKTTKMPLFEIFISMFLTELSIIIKRGLKRDYILKQENSIFLKGKLKTSDHFKKNINHQERFFVEFDEYLKNRPENRIIKSTLMYLAKKSKKGINIKRIHNYLYAFSDVDDCCNIEADFSKCKSDRLMKDYYLVLKWCRVFLRQESFTIFKGKDVAFALLFPMERIFEDYIGSAIKKYLSSEYDITLQDREHHLIIDQKKFKLIPDIILKKRGNGEAPIIADTKWKLLDENNYKNNYNISQSDLYQMYAYAKKYKSNKIILIYPKCETFTKKIDTLKQYEEGIEISVVPFDLSTILNEQELEIEVQNILNY